MKSTFAPAAPFVKGIRYTCRNEEGACYLATQGDDLLDFGGGLEEFVALQRRTWSDLRGGDVAVWRKDGHGLKLVAVLSADAAGKTCVRWL